jgi:flagellar hook-associated protein 2
MTNSINVAALGLGGIDTTSLVSSLVSIASQPMNVAQNTQANVQAASTTISNFANALSALKAASVTLSDPMSFQAMKATSSDTSIVASSSGSPAAGQWSVSVSAIAKAQRSLSSGIASSTTALGLSGTLGLSVGSGAAVPISLSATDTLSDVAGKIASAGLRVQASIMYDGSQYHLLVSGLDTGASSAVQFDESGLTGAGFSLGLSNPASTLQQAQDASLTVGGVHVTSSTNQIANAIPGVTLAITQPTTSPATVSVDGDSTALQKQVQTFVDAYNTLVTGGHSVAGYGHQKAQIALLQGDHAVRSSLDHLSRLVAAPVAGATGAYTTLGSVGVHIQDDGTLKLDAAAFQTALQADPSSVKRLFVTDPTNGSTGIMARFGSTVDSLTDPTGGVVASEIKGFTARSQQLTKQITEMQQRMTDYQAQLQKEFAQMNAALAQYKQVGASLTAAFNQNTSGK